MPYRVRKQDCAKSDGGSGTHVVQKKSGGKWSKASCHSSEEKAKSAIRARGMNEDDEDITGEGKTVRITRRQLGRIIREAFAASAEEEALKVNKETGISLVTDQAFWDERGISTGEELAKHLLASTYSDYYKDLHGIRPRWMADRIKTMSVEEIQTLIDNLDKEAEVMGAWNIGLIEK